jgi:predicted DsbA family dithiol-disulfide isomerase
MTIDVWSDIACPYCYIGKHHLEAALQQFPHNNQVQIIWHSFELDPGAPTDSKENLYEMIARKYGVSIEQAKTMTQRTAASGAAAGLTIHFDMVAPSNTHDAHRLLHLAATEGKQSEMKERLFQAYFTEGKHIGRKETLRSLALEVGIDAVSMLDTGAFSADVKKDEQEAANIGIRGVPFFVFDNKYAVSGAQPVDVFGQVLQKVWEEALSDN